MTVVRELVFHLILGKVARLRCKRLRKSAVSYSTRLRGRRRCLSPLYFGGKGNRSYLGHTSGKKKEKKRQGYHVRKPGFLTGEEKSKRRREGRGIMLSELFGDTLFCKKGAPWQRKKGATIFS